VEDVVALVQEYDDLLDEFVSAVREVFPRALLQFEDFGNNTAFELLLRYRDQICCFNDDIQGTAAVALGAILGAVNVAGTPLKETEVVPVSPWPRIPTDWPTLPDLCTKVTNGLRPISSLKMVPRSLVPPVKVMP